MARVKFGDGVSGQTGSLNKQLGGVTYMKTGIKRMRVTPNNPQTEQQSIVRNCFAFLTSQWSELTDTQREAWEAARQLPYWYVPNDFYGDTRKASSAKSLFIQVNFNLLQTTDAIDAPTVVTTDPPAVEPTDTIGITSVVCDASSDSFVLTYTGTLANDVLSVRQTGPVSPGTMRLASVKAKLRTPKNAVTGASPATVAKPGVISYTDQVGQKVFYVVEAIGTVSGKKRIVGTGSVTIQA